ncbi:phosphodiester glycosidase family protein [Providencia vermicola]|uniref:Phosphodiester glycosidase family protein n=2 Tax=Providencia stuartii TaxID=588 RepID=A0AAI9HZS8_PROST|nr:MULTISPECIES: phosphodiester glycosidase family protein [Providencia]ELR5043602.1 phosphodiester glycosidase family protein [Providencia rettgeri]ELR5035609.1 phosphodiester glycosidase family protein [Providencia stuartii]ELR5141647.1 phosphodiester glycosidase family protein [Providencia stuartii]ELR5291001.1 phosphodiester glycosidase family protein [Providencia stuartii]MBG5918367.1 phosphodiester glycosidase family protein [Providencia stuartii]
MFKYSILAILLGLNISVVHANYIDEYSSERSENWNCWGRLYYTFENRNNDNKKVSLSINTDICDRKEIRPLFVDVYLHNIKFSGASYNKTSIDIIVDIEHKLTGQTEVMRITEDVGKVSEYMKRFEYPAAKSGEYEITIKQIWLMFRNNGRTVGSFQIRGDNVRTGNGYIKPNYTNDAVMALINEAKKETLQTGKPSHIVFGGNYEIPMSTGSGKYTLANKGNLLIIPRVRNNEKYIIPHLLGDTHKGEAARCEGTASARTSDGTLEYAELYNPDEAWLKLEKPLVALNANYFDVRPQLNGATWKSNKCSTPLGIYFDNISNGPTQGTHNEPNKYFAGPSYFIDEDGSKAPLDALFWKMDLNSSIEVYYSNGVSDPAIEQHAIELDNSGYKFLAIAGTGLPLSVVSPKPTPDSGSSETTRIGIAADDNNSVIYVFQGGSYRNGISRTDLKNLYYGLGVSSSMELDGGGSAAIAIDSNAFVVKGDARPSSSCDTSGVWCSLISQPDGKHRPVPSWLGLSINK